MITYGCFIVGGKPRAVRAPLKEGYTFAQKDSSAKCFTAAIDYRYRPKTIMPVVR